MQPAPALGGMRFVKPGAQEARTWHETACAYRLREAVRRTNFMLAVRNGENACATPARLGLDVAAP